MFKISGMWSVHASKHTSIHTDARNEVTLVWGSLRLAPTTVSTVTVAQLPCQLN